VATVSGVESSVRGGKVGNEGVVFAATNGVQGRSILVGSNTHVDIVDTESGAGRHAISVVGISVGIGRTESTDVAVSSAERFASSTASLLTSKVGSMPVRRRADKGLVTSDVGTTSSVGSTAFNRITTENLDGEGNQLTRGIDVGADIGDALITTSITMIFAEVSSSESKGGRRVEEVAVEVINITTIESSKGGTTSRTSMRAVSET